ncbi:hypothetical protein RV12_GL000231 [Enterococcus quebecensis]|nr:hypothetical protein RV12_GL000231 [Enterococcus quebecensis]
MALNVFLAYIPIEISFHFREVNRKIALILGMLWLLFYPNAPYLLTDFFHLENLSIYRGMDQLFGQSLSAWLSFSLLTAGICVYAFLGMTTLLTALNECYRRGVFSKKQQGVFFFLIVNLLSSLAIFVGRFDRLHSVYLFTEPVETLKTIFLNWSVDKVLFILLFTGLQLVLLLTIVGIMKLSWTKKEEWLD